MSAVRARRRAALITVLAALVGAGSGCAGAGSGGDTAKPPTDAGGVSAAGGQAMIDAQAALARCLRRHGVDVPDPGSGERAEFDPGAAGLSEADIRQAEAKCERERRAVAEAAPRVSDADRRRAAELGLRYARCMREKGQDVPDPSLSDESGGTAIELPGDAKRDPAFQAAAAKCEQILRDGGLP
jgi:hypothetical protein